jgi:hypothetical protein
MLQASTVELSPLNTLFSPYSFDRGFKGVNEGAYFKTHFTNDSTANITLAIDTSLFSSITDSSKPYVAWSIDHGPVQKLQLTTANVSEGGITLGTGIAAGTHSLVVIYRSSDPFQDHWTPVVNFAPQSLTASSGTLVLTLPAALPNNSIFFGDSITAAVGTDGFVTGSDPSTYALNGEPMHGWVYGVAAALDSEYAQVGFGGQGWMSDAADGVTPSFPNTHAWIYRGMARCYETAPNYVFVNIGTNGNSTGPAGTVSRVLSNLRAATGSYADIFLMIPFNGSVRTTTPNLISEFQAYQGGVGNVNSTTIDGITVYRGASDAKAFLLDLGAAAQIGLSLPAITDRGGSISSYDTTHPSSFGNIGLVGLTTRAVQLALGGADSAGAY